MLDPKLLRQDIAEVAANLKKRGFILDSERIHNLEEKRKKLQQDVQSLQHTRNSKSKLIGQLKTKGESVEHLMQEVSTLGSQLVSMEKELEALHETLESIYLGIPNLLHESVPKGLTETHNVEVRKWGVIPQFDFKPLEHHVLAAIENRMDFTVSSKLTGARFVVLRNELAWLHRVLIQFMLDTHVREHGYQEHYVPYIVNGKTLTGTGHLPKFKEDLFKIDNEQDYYLIPTAEVPLTNSFQDTIIPEASLPVKLVAHTPCFRSEAGSYGKDTHGMIRQHQFEKVELVWITNPESSYQALEILTQHAENILQKLDLPYRVISKCAGDTGFSATKTYDLEVWLPGQQMYREISSCSNCEDFQARRMKARIKTKEGEKPKLVHTLNGSGLAVGRTLIAILENYQDAKKRVKIPTILQPYMQGKTYLFD